MLKATFNQYNHLCLIHILFGYKNWRGHLLSKWRHAYRKLYITLNRRVLLNRYTKAAIANANANATRREKNQKTQLHFVCVYEIVLVRLHLYPIRYFYVSIPVICLIKYYPNVILFFFLLCFTFCCCLIYIVWIVPSSFLYQLCSIWYSVFESTEFCWAWCLSLNLRI